MTKKNIHILLVEDHSLASVGVKQTLLNSGLNCHIEISQSADEARQKLDQSRFDVLLLDIMLNPDPRESRLVNGDDLLKYIRKKEVHTNVIVLSKVDNISMLDYIVNGLGVEGYVLKGRKSLSELVTAVTSVVENESYFSPLIERKLRRVDNFFDVKYLDRVILTALSQGIRQKELSEYLSEKRIAVISTSGIEKRIKKLKKQLSVKSTLEIVVQAIKEGIIEP